MADNVFPQNHFYPSLITLILILSFFNLFGMFAEGFLTYAEIPGVPKYIQTNETYFPGANDCAPVSSCNILAYWNDNGFDKLVDDGSSSDLDKVSNLHAQLKTAQSWNAVDGVFQTPMRDGIKAVCNDAGYGNNYSFDSVNSSLYFGGSFNSEAWNLIKNEIDAYRPLLLTVYNDGHYATYGAHTMTVVGYEEDAGIKDAVVHDNWTDAQGSRDTYDMSAPACDYYVLTTVLPGPYNPTAVTLSSLTATFDVRKGLVISWTVQSSLNNVGWNIYRSETKEGKYVKLNDTLIPNVEDATSRHIYQYIDQTASLGKSYYYYIEDVELTGKKTKSPIVVVNGGQSVRTKKNLAAIWAKLKRGS